MATMEDIKQATDIDELARMVDEEWYDECDGIYNDMPHWGDETEAVARQISGSCASGDIVSWDTRDPDVMKHRYLRREHNGGHEEFQVWTHAELYGDAND